MNVSRAGLRCAEVVSRLGALRFVLKQGATTLKCAKTDEANDEGDASVRKLFPGNEDSQATGQNAWKPCCAGDLSCEKGDTG